MRYECTVVNVEPLRIPRVYRLNTKCSEAVEITLEMHEDVLKIKEGEKLVIEVINNKESCLQHEFCGKAYVVSVSQIENRYRTILSIGGLLVVVKNSATPLELDVMSEVYVGFSKI